MIRPRGGGYPDAVMIVRRCWVAFGSAVLAAALVAGPVGPVGVAHAAPAPTPGAPENPTAPRSDHGGDALAQVGVVVHPAPGVPPLPGSTFSSYVVVDADTGDVLAAKDAHGRYLPASTIKVLTSLVLLPKLDPSKTLVAPPDIAKVEGTKVGIVAGTSYTIDELFRALLMSSGNDAALMLAEANVGGVAATVAQMNAEARALGAGDTLARNPHGLDADGQLSSSYDLALIFRAAMKLPAFRAYLALPRSTFPGPNGTTYQIQSHNRLLGHYAGMIGAKNGGTKAAGSTYVGEATRDGHSIIVGLMHGPGTYRQQVEALFDWGFAARGKVEPVGVLTGPDRTTSDHGENAAAGAGSGPGSGSAQDSGKSGDGVVQAGTDGASPTSAAGAHGGGMGAWEILGVVLGGLAVAVAALRVRAVRRVRRRRHQRYLERMATLSTSPPVTRRP